MIKYKVKSVKGYCEKLGVWETSPTSGLQVTFKVSLNDKHLFTLTVCEEDYLLEHQVTTLDIEGLNLLNLCIRSAENLRYFEGEVEELLAIYLEVFTGQQVVKDSGFNLEAALKCLAK